MNNDNPHDEFEARTRALLRDSSDTLDGATRSRLARARAAAVAQLATRGGASRFQLLAPAGAMAAAVLLTVLFIGSDGTQPEVNPDGTAALYDMELLADGDVFELSQEADLEFIEWAAAMAELESAGG
jgi:hypothetical protein